MKEQLQIQILGDICPAWGFRNSFDEENEGKIFGDILPLLQNADIAIANLECPLSEKGKRAVKTGPCLRGKSSDMAVLKRAGLDVIGLANNHVLDYGQDAFEDTMQLAKQHDILTVGAASNADGAKKTLFFEKNGWRIGLLAFGEEEFNVAYEASGGANLFDPYRSLEEIAEAKKNCDYLIVLYHGGIEHYELPSPQLQKKCRAMVRAGADVVLCQHSHCIGTYEKYQDATILYGQGNAIFGRAEGKQRWNLGLLVSIRLSEELKEISFHVFEAKTDGIAFLPQEANLLRLEQMKKDSERIDDQAYLKERWDAFCAKQEAEYFPMLLCWGRILNKANRIVGNRLAKHFVHKRKKMVAMNLIRCDAHREVAQTVLENSQK